MPEWLVMVSVVGFVVMVPLMVVVARRVGRRARQISAAGGDTAPGWIVQCTSCNRWRPATECGIVREFAAGTKLTIGHCRDCGIRLTRVTKGPGPIGRRRIDESTNDSVWPETIA